MTTEVTNLPAPTDSPGVRDHLAEALRLDLVGPWAGHPLEDERLYGWNRPSTWYLTGFLIPGETPMDKAEDPDKDTTFMDAGEASGPDDGDDSSAPPRRMFFPSSMGLSFLVEPGTKAVQARVRWADYVLDVIPATEERKSTEIWQRTQREHDLAIPVDGSGSEARNVAVPNSGGIYVTVVVRPVESSGGTGWPIPAGTLSVSLFLVNGRSYDVATPDTQYLFQPELSVTSATPFVPRPNLQGSQGSHGSGGSADWDEEVADLHFRDAPEFATGHGVSVDWETVNGACRSIRTEWIPSAEVEKTKTASADAMNGAVLDMDRLGKVASSEEASAWLRPLVDSYRRWIDVQSAEAEGLEGRRKETAIELLKSATVAAERIAAGIEILTADADAFEAFRTANRAVSQAFKSRKKEAAKSPSWHAFQLAFILLNLRGIADPACPDRRTVDLLFFPTGGGKTEAYLGLAAFSIALRRLRGGAGENGELGGAGVTVIMRYTLRLLTLDQLGRAAGVVCALELERRARPAALGTWPIEIGLWVGKAATPNALGKKGDDKGTAREKTRRFKQDSKRNPSPIPLDECPWCGTAFEGDSFSMRPNDDEPNELRISCPNWDCDFSGDKALPIVAVDESLYRRLPAFLVATVDKFASLPWIGESGMLLGGAKRADKDGFYGPATPRLGKPLAAQVEPPALIIQDELHLIAGPLGTMAGLYEAAIEALASTYQPNGTFIAPKIVASTATVRQARAQIQALFGRDQTEIFPPPGPDRRDSFFAQTKPASEVPARRYMGIAAQGRNPKVVLLRTWRALMSAAELHYRDDGGEKNEANIADPYMTVLGYFNSLRELGGSRRILEEQVQNTLKAYGQRKRVGQSGRLFQNRRGFRQVVELTSRVSTDQVATAKRMLEKGYHVTTQRVDCAIATNMISVGLDIDRLGLMVVFGQPKTHSEYIQATSRVGRDAKRPGLVVTLLNVHKPRDRSHFERFRHYHETFYRSVEVSSATPFAARAMDRGFAGAFVALARHSVPALTPAFGANEIEAWRGLVEETALMAFHRRVSDQHFDDPAERDERVAEISRRVSRLLDTWIDIVRQLKEEGAGRLRYQQHEPRRQGGAHLLQEMLTTEFADIGLGDFRANRSLRDVEPEVNLWVRDIGSQGIEKAAEK